MLWIYITALLAVAQAGLFSRSHVLKLTAGNFRERVLNNDNVTVVEFYAPWCGHCKTSAPELKKSAKSLYGIARVGAVNCDAPENKALCAHYKIEGFPTIKVFQPAKKTDKDFEAINLGEKIKRKKHNVINYTGPRDSRAINKFAVSKIRNYAATLDGDLSFVWLKANGVPRVIMLPGSKYKSKSIAPLFKTLSNEFFGKLRFAYIPRRVDGGWNMLGLQAPENSTLVYMSDDKVPYVYKGELTKSKVTEFLNEQYSLEMTRRAKPGYVSNAAADSDVGRAFGLEYVKEDQQEEPLIAQEREEREFQENWSAYNYYINSARERRARSVASAKDVEYTPIPSTTISIKYTRAWTPAEAPTSEPNLESFDDFTAKVTAAPSVADEGSVDSEVVEEAEIDDGEAGSATDLEDYTDAMLDEIDYDLAPEEIVAEGPEAVASWRKELEGKVEELKDDREKKLKRAENIAELRAKQLLKKQDEQRARNENFNNPDKASESKEEVTPVQKLPPGITPRPVATEKAPVADDLSEQHYLELNALRNMDDLLENCVRRDILCVLCSSSKGFIVNDVNILLRTRAKFDSKTQGRVVFQFYDEDLNPELKEFSGDLGLSPYNGERKNSKGVSAHNPGLAIFDYTTRRFAVFNERNGAYNVDDITQFIANFMLKKGAVARQALPLKYLYYVTDNDMEVIDKYGTTEDGIIEDENSHDEL